MTDDVRVFQKEKPGNSGGWDAINIRAVVLLGGVLPVGLGLLIGATSWNIWAALLAAGVVLVITWSAVAARTDKFVPAGLICTIGIAMCVAGAVFIVGESPHAAKADLPHPIDAAEDYGECIRMAAEQHDQCTKRYGMRGDNTADHCGYQLVSHTMACGHQFPGEDMP